jgi:hypothetical protein
MLRPNASKTKANLPAVPLQTFKTSYNDAAITVYTEEQLSLLQRAMQIPGVEGREVALPAWYEAAVKALEQCDHAQESTVFIDMAQRAQLLARQAKDQTMILLAKRINFRAWHKLGELLKQVPSIHSGPPRSGETIEEAADRRQTRKHGPNEGPQPSRTAIARQAGVSPGMATRAERFADIPREIFEELIESQDPPSGTQLLEIAAMGAGMDKKGYRNMEHSKQGMRAISLKAMGPLTDFMNRHRPEAIAKVFASESSDMLPRARNMSAWLDAFCRCLQKTRH